VPEREPCSGTKYRRPPTELEGTVIHDDLIEKFDLPGDIFK